MKAASECPMKGVLGYTDEKVVATDFRGESCTSTFDADAGIALDSTFVKVVAWYDKDVYKRQRQRYKLALTAIFPIIAAIFRPSRSPKVLLARLDIPCDLSGKTSQQERRAQPGRGAPHH